MVAIIAATFTVRACSTKEQRDEITETTSKIATLVVLLLFPGLSTKVFQMFKCQRIEGIEFRLLVQDYSVTCYQGDHPTFIVLAIVFLILYTLGIPLTMFLLMWRNRKHLYDESSPKHPHIKTALGGLYTQYEPEYWWFELMVLFNKTMMCGGLVILAPGSPMQVLFAILIMLLHLLFLLKLAPYGEYSEDWASFLATLGLFLIAVGAYSMMIQLQEQDRKNIELVTTILPFLCIASVVLIAIAGQCELKKRLCGESKTSKTTKLSLEQEASGDSDEHVSESKTKILPKLNRLMIDSVQKIADENTVVTLENTHAEQRKKSVNAIQAKKEIASARVRQRVIKRQNSRSSLQSKNKDTNDSDGEKHIQILKLEGEKKRWSEQEKLDKDRDTEVKKAADDLAQKAKKAADDVAQKASVATEKAEAVKKTEQTIIDKTKKAMLARVKTEERLHKLFCKLDMDNSGLLSKEEFQRLVEASLNKKVDETTMNVLWIAAWGQRKHGKEDEMDATTLSHWLGLEPSET
jgi:hypothetical protein